MIEVTGVEQWRAWQANVLPPVERVRPGLWSIPVPIPRNPLRYVLVYVFELPGGVALVDSGWPTPDAWRALVSGLAQTGHSISDVRAVLVTHVHADHHGLGARVRAESGAWIGMHALEAATLGKRSSPQDAIERMRAWIIGLGASPDEAADLAGSSKDMAPFLDLAQPDRLIEDGDEPLGPALRLRAVWTPGHTPGHLCFFDESADLLLSGDHVLPRISPNISLLPGGDADPLGDYLTSLERVGKLDAAEVLPAHEYRFAGLPDRTEDLRRHHAARLHEIELVVLARPGVTTWQVAEQLTWSRRWTELGPQRRFALGETLAHLVRLAELGRLERSDTGIDRWWPAGAGADGRPRSAG